MSKKYPKIELASNILFILVSILLLGIIIQKYFFTTAPERITPKIGNKISLPDTDWSKTDKNILLVLSKDCRFCDESVDFYKKLISDTKGKNVNIVAVLPQGKKAAEEWLNGHGIQGIEIRQSQLNSLDVGGTPTLIILNNKGEVSNFWVGQLSAERQKEVSDKLN